MNTFYKRLFAVAGLALSFSLVSCQENNLIPADKPVVASTESVNDLIPVGLPKKYTLIKHGQVTLTYMNDGRLQKAAYGPGPIGYPYTYVIYTYGLQSIKATAYSGNTIVLETTYLLDANTGRCYEAKETSFVFYSFGTVTLEQSWIYQYNATGQLKSRGNKSYGGWTDYVFNAAGDMSKATTYTSNSVATKEITFAYDQPVGDPILTDRSPINSDWTALSDPYLKIFGKASKHLMKLVTEKNLSGNHLTSTYVYTYTLNADGYVTEEKEFNVLNAALISTKAYAYLVTDIGFQQ